MTTGAWPSYARIVSDGYRISWRAPVQRIQFDDGMVRQAMTGTGIMRVRDFECLLEGDADRDRFDAWVDGLGPIGTFVFSDIPDGVRRVCRIQGGRSGVRWTGKVMRDQRLWWRAAVTVEGLETAYAGPLFVTELDDQTLFQFDPHTIHLPASVTRPTGLVYSLSPGPPAGMHLSLNALTLSGQPSVIQAPTEYTWTATDAAGNTDTVTFRVSVGVSIWDAARAPLGDASHIYYRFTRASPGAAAIGLEGPARDVPVIYLWGGVRVIADSNAALPAWMYEHVPAGQTPYIRWPILESTEDGQRLLQLGMNNNRSSPFPLWSIPDPNPVLVANIGGAVRIGGVSKGESIGALGGAGGIYPRIFGQALPTNGDTFAALRNRAGVRDTTLGFLVAYIGPGSVVDLEHGITYLGGVRPTPGA